MSIAINLFLGRCQICVFQRNHSFFFPQLEQAPPCTQIVPPHSGQVHLVFSFAINSFKPNSLIYSRFSIMLILYLVRYLSSNCFNLLQGNFLHSKQNCALPFSKVGQCLICLHLELVTSNIPQPGHLFLSLR